MNDRADLIDQIVGVQIRLLASALPEETSSLLDYDLTLQQIRVFAYVYASGQAPINRVADALSIRPNVATGIIQRLVDRGLVERQEDAGDRRVRILRVTDRGTELVDELTRIIAAKERKLLERLSDEQLRRLGDLLTGMEPLPEG